MIEKVVVHVIAIALLMGGIQPDIFIQIHSGYHIKIQIIFSVPINQLFIGADDGGAGREP